MIQMHQRCRRPRFPAVIGMLSALAVVTPVAYLAGAISEPPEEIESDAAPYRLGLIGSAHDFGEGEDDPRNLCLPCHAPHLPGSPRAILEPEDRADKSVSTYSGEGIELNRASLLCMSCHDGVVATDVFTSAHATRLASQLGPDRVGYGGLVGHPVGINYPAARDKFNTAAAVQAAGVKLPGGRIQCTSCHDPHNSGRHERMLIMSDERSRLCLTCHRI